MDSASFFTKMKNYVTSGLNPLPGKNKQSVWGRYFAICLQEVLRENIKLVRILFNIQEKAKIVLEYPYPERRADIAILDNEDQLRALVEIKIDDSLRKGQLESYLKFCKERGAKFFLITRWSPTYREKKLINSAGHEKPITLFEVHKKIRENHSTSKHPLSKMFCDFLEESKMVYKQNISNDLSFLAQKIFFNSNRDNHVSISKLKEGIPESLSAIYTNLEIVTRELMDRMGINQRKLSLNIWFNPICKKNTLQAISRRLKKYDDEEEVRAKDLKIIDSGIIWFNSLINLGNAKSTFCSFELGIYLEIDSKGKQPDLKFYWQINPDSDEVTYKEVPLSYSKKLGAWTMSEKEIVVKMFEDGFFRARQKYEKKYKGAQCKEAARIPHLNRIVGK